MKKHSSCFRLFLVAFIAGVATSQAIVIVSDDFNGYTGITTGLTPLNANYFLNGSNDAGIMTTLGLGGSQSLSPFGGPDASGTSFDFTFTRQTAYDYSTAPGALTIGMYFQRGSGGTGQGNPHLGMLPNSGVTLGSGSDVSFRIDSGSQLDIFCGGGTGAVSNVQTYALTTGNWYYLTGTYTKGSGATITLDVSVFNSSNTGILGLQLGSTYSAGLTHSISNDTTAYFALRATGNGTNAQAAQLDNFSVSVIPETSSALFSGVGALVCLARRRRRA